MIIRFLALILLGILGSQSMGQTPLSATNNYMRFEGQLGEDVFMTANLIQLFDKVSGNYQYQNSNNDNTIDNAPIDLQGELSNGNELSLYEYGNNEPCFVGILESDGYSGSWTSPENNSVEFELSESYPKGSMAFDIFYLRSEAELSPEESNSPVAEVEFILLYPKSNYEQPYIADSIKQLISKHFFGKKYDNPSPDTMLSKLETEYMTNYIEQNKDWHNGGTSFSWEKMINMQVIHNSGNLLCLEYIKYVYTGGAHGMTHTSFDIISLEDGKSLAYEHIFRADTKDSLGILLTNKLRALKQIPAEVNLKEAGYFVETITPNHNIFVNNTGIGFLYNNYEIAAYATGASIIFLDFNEITDLLLTEGTVYNLTKK